MSHVFLQAVITLFEPMHLLFLCMGAAMGLIVGILPGLGGVAGLSVVLPFVYGLDPTLALPMMIGLTATTTASDTFPSVLMGIPGTVGSAATILDGFSLAKKGDAARALGAAFSAALIGGVFGALILTSTIYIARPLILAIGFGEQLMLIVLALTMVGMLTGDNLAKGLASCGLGLLLGSIGDAPATGEYRLTFDTVYLMDGLPLVVVALSMFAMPEMVEILRRHQAISSLAQLGSGWMRGFTETLRYRWLVLRCSALGTVLGALPGLGGAVIDWVAYGHLVQTAGDRSLLGRGDIRGVIAPESANNAKEGGALVPTLMFGIPGSGSMAVLLGGFTLIGIEPGIDMVGRNLDLTYLIIWSLALAHLFAASTCIILAKPIARLTLVKFTRIAPFMIAIICFAAYQASRSWYDLVALFILSPLGMYMKRFGWSRPALLIGFVLARRLDGLIYQSIEVYGFGFLHRTGVQIILALIVISIVVAVRMRPHRAALTAEGPHSGRNRPQQMAFLGVLLIVVGYALYDASRLTFLARVFPMTIELITLVLLAGLAVLLVSKRRASYVFYDSELEWTADEQPSHSHWYYQAWFLGLLVAIGLFGFLLGMLIYISIFLKAKAGVGWHWAALGAACAVAVLAFLAYFLVLQYPAGLLQMLVNMPWPFG